MESVGSTVDGLEQICRQQNSLYTEAEVRADPYSAFNSMYNSGRGNFLLRCNEFVLSRFSPCLDSRSHSYAYASEAHRYYKRLYERGGVVTRLDSLKYRGKIFLTFSSFSCKLHIFNLFAFFAESCLFLERENQRSMQLDLELRHHAFVRDEKLQQHDLGMVVRQFELSG